MILNLISPAIAMASTRQDGNTITIHLKSVGEVNAGAMLKVSFDLDNKAHIML